MTLLTEQQLNDALPGLQGWQVKPDMIEKEFSFDDFKQALDFVNKVGDIAERLDHHPDIFLSWGKVHLQITTHSEGGVTEKDLEFAQKVECP